MSVSSVNLLTTVIHHIVKAFLLSRFKTLKNSSGSQVTAASGSGGISLAFREIEVLSIVSI